jgi:hypothetical protein
MEKGSLEDRLRDGPLPAADAVALLRDVAVGLVHAHGKGILHCDLKPGNILLDQDDKPRLADFGQSRLSHEQAASLGTLFYMAPEQADLRAFPDARWDVYALGALFYRLLTGQPPRRTEEVEAELLRPGTLEERLERYRRVLREAPQPDAHRRVAGVDAALAEVIDRCLAVNPKARYANVQAVLNALDARAQKRARRPLLVLGAVGPALVVLVMGLVGAYLLNLTLSTAGQELTGRALESNHFAAQSLADRFALEVDKRWRILEQEAADPRLRGWLKESLDAPAGTKRHPGFQGWLEGRHADHDGQFTPATRARSWFVVNRAGTQLARSPWSDLTVDKNFAYRDYFHGLGRDFDPTSKVPRPPPIRKPHLSIFYVSKATDRMIVSFSVPVWDGPPGGSEPLGVLAMTAELGHCAALQGSRDQFAVLVDTRPGASDRRGLVVGHPRLHTPAKGRPGVAEFYVAPGVVEQAARLRTQRVDELQRQLRGEPPRPAEASAADSVSDYRDPLEEDYAGVWLVTLEPVLVPRGRDEVRDTGWVVLVQERQEDTLRPVRGLRGKLVYGGLAGLGLVVLVVTALWGFVILVLNDPRGSRLIAFLRRRVGLSTPRLSGGSSPSSQRPSDGPAPGSQPRPEPAASPQATTVAEKPQPKGNG